jgi:uncharacterized delta-60 repeat protein
VAVGASSIVRYDSDGVLDATFGNGGVVETYESAQAIALQSDGKLVVVGYHKLPRDYTVFTARYLANGDVDSSFSGGVVFVPFMTSPFGGYTIGYGVTTQPNGMILIAGLTLDELFVVRYLSTHGLTNKVFLPVLLN